MTSSGTFNIYQSEDNNNNNNNWDFRALRPYVISRIYPRIFIHAQYIIIQLLVTGTYGHWRPGGGEGCVTKRRWVSNPRPAHDCARPRVPAPQTTRPPNHQPIRRWNRHSALLPTIFWIFAWNFAWVIFMISSMKYVMRKMYYFISTVATFSRLSVFVTNSLIMLFKNFI